MAVPYPQGVTSTYREKLQAYLEDQPKTAAHLLDGQEKPVETVNHPPHYNKHPSGVECIQVVEHMGFNLGNAMKYVWRADLKNDAIEDLKKAAWYIEREIQRRARSSRL